METTLQYKLPVFEGPLDLLLTLISKNKIDIYDIQISDLLDQYMEQINLMQENQMDIASEFLTMASRLVYIKSVMLLPKYEEEAEELKKELSGQLIEYAVCREIAAKLSVSYDFDTFFRAPSPVEFDLTYNRVHPSEDIAKAYVSAVGRGKRKLPPSEQAFSGIVAHKIVSVNGKIIHLMRRLRHGKKLEYHEIFEICEGKSDLVATFLATLELVKGKRIRIEGSGENAVVRMIE
ncbi:MAG: segregation/condensation protein A [Oscillospiraceae bacterium]|jgi:segregation and condensation protein A|nr:segregation/condensation protein A [Oscillospiraceae bacterium]